MRIIGYFTYLEYPSADDLLYRLGGASEQGLQAGIENAGSYAYGRFSNRVNGGCGHGKRERYVFLSGLGIQGGGRIKKKGMKITHFLGQYLIFE